MSTLQVKHLSDEVHAKVRARARAQHLTVSVYVARVLEREVAKPSLEEWFASLDELPQLEHDIDVQSALDAAKDEIEGP